MSTDGSSLSLGPKQILGVLAAIGLVVSAFLNWADVSGLGGSAQLKGTDVPVEFLVDKNADSSDPSILVLLVIAAVLIGITALMVSTARGVGIGGAALGIVVVVLYCVQVQRGLDDELAGLDIGLFDFISTGVYVALVAGIVGLVSALVPSAEAASPAPSPPSAPPPA